MINFYFINIFITDSLLQANHIILTKKDMQLKEILYFPSSLIVPINKSYLCCRIIFVTLFNF